MTDPHVEAVIRRIRERSDRGVAKYGHTLDRQDLTLVQWLRHFQEEAMDAALYVERIIAEVERAHQPDNANLKGEIERLRAENARLQEIIALDSEETIRIMDRGVLQTEETIRLNDQVRALQEQVRSWQDQISGQAEPWASVCIVRGEPETAQPPEVARHADELAKAIRFVAHAPLQDETNQEPGQR